MLLFSKNIQRELSKIPRILPLDSVFTRFKIWEKEDLREQKEKDKKIYSISIETGKTYATLDQDKGSVLKKDPADNSFWNRMVSPNPYACDGLKNHIVNEHILNGEPDHVVTLAGLKSETIEKDLTSFFFNEYEYKTHTLAGVGMSAVIITHKTNMQELLSNILVKSGIESILKRPMESKCDSGIIQALVQAEKIEKGQESSNQNTCKK